MTKSQTFNSPNNSDSVAVDATAPRNPATPRPPPQAPQSTPEHPKPDQEIRVEPIPSAATQSINAISVIMNNFLAGKCTAASASAEIAAAEPENPFGQKKGQNKPFSCTL